MMMAAWSVVAGEPQSLAPGRQNASNQELADSVAATLNRSGRLQNFTLDIEAIDGAVTLRGTVAGPNQRETALDLARSVPGVLAVDDRIDVQAQARLLPVAYQPPVEQVTPGTSAPAVERVGPSAPEVPAAIAPPVPEHILGPGLPQYAWPNLPQYAWPSYAPYPNYSAVGYPTTYPANCWPYIGPFYPYPEVPLGWRNINLSWKDGVWWLRFNNYNSLVGSLLHGLEPGYGHGHDLGWGHDHN